jgi:hypothetical protein
MHHPVKLTADLIESFAGTFLSPRYDQPVATPQFHRRGWEAYCSMDPLVDLVAPREHAKSTSLTFVFILAETLFRASDYVILISSTEELAAEQLSNIREELLENTDLREEFGVVELEKDSTTDIIVKCDDGYRFRVLARGSEQKIRGRLWKGKRPNLMVCDDLEDDEQVENKDRRSKFRRWFFRAARQALGRGGRLRVHGTILHEDSLLARLQKSKAWKSLFFKAHTAFDDFANILWPEAWPEKRLRTRRQEFVEDGDAAGYSQEFLNDPQDSADAYLRKQDFLPMSPADFERPKIIGASADFAVSKNDLANRTSFNVGGKCTQNLIHFLDFRVDRWASLEVLPDGSKVGWIEEMFSIQKRWEPEFFWVESGVIWDSVKHMVFAEMRERDIYINIVEVPSVKDKASRGRVLQKRMRAGGCRFNKEHEKYVGFEVECLKFTGASEATLDDQFDSASLLARGFELYMDQAAEREDFLDPEELEIELRARRRFSGYDEGRSPVTGY